MRWCIGAVANVWRTTVTAWTDHVEKWKDCTACPLCQQRDRIVLARGQVPCDVLFIGEAPGASEDALGLPFKGPAGHLLDDIISHSLLMSTKYALTNLVCCYPREAKILGENEPLPEEIKACAPRLKEFVRFAQPRLIVRVGQLAAAYVAQPAMFSKDGRSAPEWILPGRYLELIEIVHPAAVLRMPLAQKNMAVQRAIVQIRTALESMILSEQEPITKGVTDASIAQKPGDTCDICGATEPCDHIPF